MRRLHEIPPQNNASADVRSFAGLLCDILRDVFIAAVMFFFYFLMIGYFLVSSCCCGILSGGLEDGLVVIDYATNTPGLLVVYYTAWAPPIQNHPVTSRTSSQLHNCSISAVALGYVPGSFKLRFRGQTT